LIPGIDAVIMPVVSRNTIKRGNKRVVKLGDKEIVLNAPWRPILTVDAGDAGRAGLRVATRVKGGGCEIRSTWGCGYVWIYIYIYVSG
jgi:hypothetical protein